MTEFNKRETRSRNHNSLNTHRTHAGQMVFAAVCATILLGSFVMMANSVNAATDLSPSTKIDQDQPQLTSTQTLTMTESLTETTRSTSDNANSSRISQMLALQTSEFAYNGQVVAENRVDVVAQSNGMVLGVQAKVGDHVRQGDPLVQIDSAIPEAQRAQAMAGLLAAQAQLELVLEPADQSDVAAAQASIAAAEASYQTALEGPTADDLRGAEVRLRQAEAAVKVAQSAYNQVRFRPNVGALPQSLQLEQATLAYEGALADYDSARRGNRADVIANANAQLINARSQLEGILEGANTAQIRSAQAQISQAETSLYLAQLQLDRTIVRAPINGIISTMQTSIGSTVGSGTPVAVIISQEVKVVIAVEDFRLPTLQIGQQVRIRVNAYPDQEIEGAITTIAPELNPETRAVDVTIDPTSSNAKLLLPGMFASVDLVD